MKTVKFYTLGCKVNLYETETLKSMFEKEGYLPVDSENADIIVINTCTVTSTGDKKSRQLIRRAKRENPGSIVAVVGCYAQVAPDEVSKIPEADIIAGTADKFKILDYIKQYDGFQINAVNNEISVHYDDMFSFSQSRTRAMLKIQDGCENYCSYCIIPYARGPIRSRPCESVAKEAKILAEKGFTEVVLVGIHLSSYGRDINSSLTEAVRTINEVEGIKRIRLGSLEPLSVDRKFARELSGIAKVCPSFHVSMQSGCDETLRRMNRKYTSEQYLQSLENLREFFPGCAVSTDVMVGFPGESDYEFEKTLKTISKARFASLHVFQYSRRKGTPAADMKNQVSEDIKALRSQKVIALGEKLKEQYCKDYINQIKEVLFEDKTGNFYEGFTENYIRVRAVGSNLKGQYKNVEILEYKDGYCVGEIKSF